MTNAKARLRGEAAGRVCCPGVAVTMGVAAAGIPRLVAGLGVGSRVAAVEGATSIIDHAIQQ